MTTIVTFCILAAAGVVSWWLLRDVLPSRSPAPGSKCPVCGSGRTEPFGASHRCTACGARFHPHGRLRLRAPTLAAISVILLGFFGLLAFALSDMLLGWQIMGTARGALTAAAAATGAAACVARIVHHRGQARRN